jgi:hypothetical protein
MPDWRTHNASAGAERCRAPVVDIQCASLQARLASLSCDPLILEIVRMRDNDFDFKLSDYEKFRLLRDELTAVRTQMLQLAGLVHELRDKVDGRALAHLSDTAVLHRPLAASSVARG